MEPSISQKLSDAVLFSSVLDRNAKAVPFHSLLTAKKNLIVFVRHFNWYVCRDFVVALAPLPKLLESQSMRLIVIGCSPPQRISSFAYETGFPDKEIFTDPDLKAYKSLGLVEAQNFSQLKGHGEKSVETKVGLVRGLLWFLWKSIWHRNMNVYQLGGAIIVGQDKTLAFKKVDTSPEDHIGVEQLLKEAGAQNK